MANRSAEKLLVTVSPSLSVSDAVKSRLTSLARFSTCVVNSIFCTLMEPLAIVSWMASTNLPLTPEMTKDVGALPVVAMS
ncbi:hypothetical protein D3C78_1522550 [compost metagenome]